MHYETVSDTIPQQPSNQQSIDRNIVSSSSPNPAAITTAHEHVEPTQMAASTISTSTPPLTDVPSHSTDKRMNNRLTDDNHYIHLYNEHNCKSDSVKESNISNDDNNKELIKKQNNEKVTVNSGMDAVDRSSCWENSADDVVLRNPKVDKEEVCAWVRAHSSEQFHWVAYNCKIQILINLQQLPPVEKTNSTANLTEEIDVYQYLVLRKEGEDGPDVKGGPLDALIVHATKVQKVCDNGKFVNIHSNDDYFTVIFAISN